MFPAKPKFIGNTPLFNVIGDTTSWSNACSIGYMLLAASKSSYGRQRPLHLHSAILEPAVAFGNFQIYFDDLNNSVGYAVWAKLSKETEERFLRTGKAELHYSEWNEGESCWIIDFVANNGSLRFICEHLAKNVFQHEKKIRYFRRKRTSITAREIVRPLF